MNNYLIEINKIKKQREKIDKKIKEEALALEKLMNSEKVIPFKSKAVF